MATEDGGAPIKKQRIHSNNAVPSAISVIDFSGNRKPSALRRSSSSSRSLFPISSSCACRFNDSSTADVIVTLRLDRQSGSFDCLDVSSASRSVAAVDQSEAQIYLHSHVLHRSEYFAALLSGRWQPPRDDSSHETKRFSLFVPARTDSIDHHIAVLKLLYSDDLVSSFDCVSTVLNFLPIALELLFEDCIKSCVKFLEAVPWSEDEEKRILKLIPLLGEEESKELLARVSPLKDNSSEEMLYGLILSAIQNHPNVAFSKAFVAKLLRDFSSRGSARKVLDATFEKSLKIVRQAFEEYLSPTFRGDNNETEAIQRLNLHTAIINGKHLLWLVERMIELRVADTAVREWSEQGSFTGDLQRVLRDDAWRTIVPSLPSVVLRCTCKLANAVATGNILAAKQVRMKLVRVWLPVLILCKDRASFSWQNHKALYLELEESFLSIISTLAIPDAQDLLQQCLSFSTRAIDDCPHLVAAFTTWFRRANRPPLPHLYK